MLLTNKVALITGGGRGIGEASARRLAEYGAKVILADMDLESASAVAEDINAHGGQARALEFNVAQFEAHPRQGRSRRAPSSAGLTFWSMWRASPAPPPLRRSRWRAGIA